MMDKFDMLINKLEVMQFDINDIKSKIQTTINNQVKITNALNQNFQTIVDKQIAIAIVLDQSFKDVQKNIKE